MSQLSASLNLSLAEYLNPDFDDHLPSFDQEPMSPAPPQSTSSTPPPAANHNVNHHVNNTNSSVAHASATNMASFGAPVPISTAHYGMPLSVSAYPPPPRRAEHSYAHYNPPSQQQQQQQHQYPYMTNGGPATLPPPAPPSHALPKNRALQLPQSSSMLIQSPTIVPPVPSSAPDAPPSGSGPASGARKRPKYTRSKKGCLTCRSKKIKCDERKPMCTRCEHGHRECTWPEAVLPRRPKGAVRGVGNEEDMDDEDEERRQSMPGSAVSTHFPPSATSTSPTHYSGVGNNSPFEPAPRRDGYDASQFSMPSLPASGRHFYARGPGSADFQTITNVNSIEDYEFPPRQSFGTGSTTLSRGYATTSGYLAGPPGVTPYNADVRRASWDSSAPTDGRRPSWDANSIAGAHTSSVSSPASSVLGLGVGVAGASGSRGATNPGHGSSGGLMLLQSPDPLSPFFRSVQERNLVGNISSTATSSSFLSSSSSPFYNSSFASSSSSSLPIDVSKSFATTATHVTNMNMSGYDFSNPAVSPVLSTASSSDILSRKNSFPHLYPPPRPLTIDPPLPMSTLGVDLSGPSVNLLSLAEQSAKTEEVQWIAPPSHMELFKPFGSPEEVEYGSMDAYS